MEIFVGAAVLIAVLLFVYHRGVAEIDGQSQNDDVSDVNSGPKWKSVNYKWGEDTRDPGWVALEGASDVKVVGPAKSNVLAFVNQIIPGEGVLELVREPSNPQDKNAIALFGTPSKTAMRLHLGYIPEKIAADIAEKYSPKLPIEPELRCVGWRDGGEDTCFVAINLLVPNDAERKQYALN